MCQLTVATSFGGIFSAFLFTVLYMFRCDFIRLTDCKAIFLVSFKIVMNKMLFRVPHSCLLTRFICFWSNLHISQNLIAQPLIIEIWNNFIQFLVSFVQFYYVIAGSSRCLLC